MRALLAIILATAFLFQSAGKLLIVVNYSINKTAIAKTLCENKAKPKMKCNGKCHLRKQLQKEEKKENAPTNSVKEKFEVQFFSEKKIADLIIITKEKTKVNTIYTFAGYDSHLSAVFQPPRA